MSSLQLVPFTGALVSSSLSNLKPHSPVRVSAFCLLRVPALTPKASGSTRTTPSPLWTRLGGVRATARGSDYSSRRGGNEGSNEPRETILLPGRDYNHWLIVMEFPKDPAPTRDQMIQTYLDTLATVLGSMEEAKKNMYAFSTTAYTGFQCTVDEETSEKLKGVGLVCLLQATVAASFPTMNPYRR